MASVRVQKHLQADNFKNRSITIRGNGHALLQTRKPANIGHIPFTLNGYFFITGTLYLIQMLTDALARVTIKQKLLLNAIPSGVMI